MLIFAFDAFFQLLDNQSMKRIYDYYQGIGKEDCTFEDYKMN